MSSKNARCDNAACMIVEAASTDEVAEKLGALPLVREGYLQPPSIVVRRSATLYG